MTEGLFLIALGLILWLSNLGIWVTKRDWPWFLMVLGLLSIASHFEIKRKINFRIERRRKKEE